MTEVKDIKDKKPNPELIEQIKKLLKDAESGEVRSAVWCCSWNDNATSHGWALDPRSFKRYLLTEIILMQDEYMTNLQLGEETSVLSQAIDGEGR